MKKIKLLVFGFIALSSIQSKAGLLYNYSELALRNLDQMTKIVSDKLTEAKKTKEGKVIPLREALQAVYSRPNPDGMIEKVISPLRMKLDDLNAWDKSMSQLTEEAIGALTHPEKFKPIVQVTYVVFLHNYLSEVKPLLKEGGIENKLVTQIRDAKIEISKSAQDEIRLRMMKMVASPSVIADSMLRTIPVEKNTVPGQ